MKSFYCHVKRVSVTIPKTPINSEMKQVVFRRLKRFVSIFLVALTPGFAWGVDSFESLKIIQTTHPNYPMRLTQIGLYEGYVRLLIAVDYRGELNDVFVEEYTHETFAKIAEETVWEWEYVPAKVNGEPTTVVKALDFRFEDRTGLHSVDVMAAAADKLGLNKMFGKKRVYSLEDLDAIPEPIEVVKPKYPLEFKDEGVEGNVSVLFYIDEEGRVRMPHITEFSHVEFAELALNAVKQWKFKPPIKRGKPVSIMVSQPFTFVGDVRD